VPAARVLALVMVGSWVVDVKLLGPVHVYVEPPTVLALKLRSSPEHRALLLVAEGAEGIEWIVMITVPAGLEVQPGTFAITE
jgi:hypothetical protein